MERIHPTGTLAACLLLLSFYSITTHAALVGRDLDGNLSTAEAYYDTVLMITWLADANYAQTSGSDADGLMDWASANSWAASLDPYSSGISGWRLPDTNPVDGAAYDYNFYYDGTTDKGYNISAPGTTYAGSTGSEMAHMFYTTLGNLGICDSSTASTCTGPQAGYGLSNTGPFTNIQSDYYYWSGTEDMPATTNAFVFNFGWGLQQYQGTTSSYYYAWAVHSGDVGAAVVPVPAAVWLFGSGLAGLLGMAGGKRWPAG